MSGGPVHNFRRSAQNRPMPLDSESFADFDGREVPNIHWLIPGILVKGGVTMLSGAGGKGKSLLCMQLQGAAALGQPWLGIDLPEPMRSFGLYCEDDRETLHRRMYDVARHYGATFPELEMARFKSRVGMANELMTFYGRKDDGEITNLFRQIREEIELWNIKIIIIDTAADTFAGNENIRPQVRAYVNALRGLVVNNGGGVILNAHPSRAGLSDGSGMSGSTAWEGSVRARIYLTEPKRTDPDVEGESEPTKERLLKTMKNNYGPAGEVIRLAWEAGVFVRTDQGGGGGGIVERLDAAGKLLEAARYMIDRGAFLSAATDAPTSLVKKAKGLPSCKMLSWKALVGAQDALLADGRLVMVEMGPPSKRRKYIRPSNMLYPGEVDGGAKTNTLL